MKPAERDQLISLCARLGATPDQAAVMADQLLRRGEQLAAERGWSREAAMEHLLRILVQGRAGVVPPGLGAPSPVQQQQQSQQQ